MTTKEKNSFSEFFKEDAENIQNILHPELNDTNFKNAEFEQKVEISKISPPKEISLEEFQKKWRQMRSFFRNGKNDKKLDLKLSPLHLSNRNMKEFILDEYPIFLNTENFTEEVPYCGSLKEIILNTLNRCNIDQVKESIIFIHIERIIQNVNKLLLDSAPLFFRPTIISVLNKLQTDLQLTAEVLNSYTQEIKLFTDKMPKNGVIIPFDKVALFKILENTMSAILVPARIKLANEINKLEYKIQDILKVEDEKKPSSNEAKNLHDSYSFVDSMLKFDELVSLIPESGSQVMGNDRIERIQTVLEDLKTNALLFSQYGFLYVNDLFFYNKDYNWNTLFPKNQIEVFQDGNGCDAIMFSFKKEMGLWAKLFKAMRIADLELNSSYDSEIHDDYFKNFNWQNFTLDELNSCPKFLLIADSDQLFETEFNKLSKLLSEHFPIKVIALKTLINSKNGNEELLGMNLHSQPKLATLMLSQNNIYINQSTVLSPNFLAKGFTEGFLAFSPAIYSILNTNDSDENHALMLSAAIEGRDFPGFVYNGQLGLPWGSRFNLENNPQPDKSWPIHEIEIINHLNRKEILSAPFSFADNAFLNDDYFHYFLPVDSSYWNENLISITEFMKRNHLENMGKLPFIWMKDEGNNIYKSIVCWEMVMATQERLDFWRFLQENSGINNYHVLAAVEEVKKEMKAVFDFEIEQLQIEQKIEIQKIRDEEADKVIGNLTSFLLDLDFTNLEIKSDNKVNVEPIIIDEVPVVKEIREKKPNKVESGKIAIEAYIDTPLCTACNECVGLNGNLFKYNSEKLAYVADVKAGTFKELVEAAEVCPVGIIHPGTPINPDEADLTQLLKRAEKFN